MQSTLGTLDGKITEILRVVDEIQAHSKPVIERCYRDFLRSSSDPEEREYPDPADHIREVLIHGNYLSQRDTDICLAFVNCTWRSARSTRPMLRAARLNLSVIKVNNSAAPRT